MPRIPIITSGGAPAIAQAPRAYGVDTGGTVIAQHGLNTLSESLSDIATRIQQDKSETELIKAQYNYDPELQRIRKEVLVDPKIDNPFLTFNDRAGELQQSYLDSIQNPNVKRAFSNHIAKTFPQVQQDALDDVLKLQNQKNIAGLHETGDLLSTAAATGTPEIRDQAIADYNEKVDRSARKGTINAIQAVDFKRKFRIDTMTKNMTALALDDPYKMFELHRQGAYSEVDAVVQQRVMAGANAKIEADDGKREKIYKEAQKTNVEYLGFQALNGGIPDDDLELMAQGRHPYVTDPHVAKSLIAQNADPISVANSKPIEAIMLDFESMSKASPELVLEAARKTRERLDAYRIGLTKRDPSLSKAYKEVGSAEMSMSSAEARGRAELRTIENLQHSREREVKRDTRQEEADKRAEIHREQTRAADMYKASGSAGTTAGAIVPMVGKMEKSQAVIDLNTMDGLIEKGWKAEDAFNFVTKNREKQGPRIPERNQGTINIAPRR